MSNNKIQSDDPLFSNKVAARFEEIVNKNELFFSDELHILKVLHKKYPLLTFAEFADKNKLTPNGVKYKAEKELIPYIELGNKTFIISNLFNAKNEREN